jgi:hypothetical protein
MHRKNLRREIYRGLVGAGMAHVVGGIVGVFILPLGWLTLLFASCILIGGYIALDSYYNLVGTG